MYYYTRQRVRYIQVHGTMIITLAHVGRGYSTLLTLQTIDYVCYIS